MSFYRNVDLLFREHEKLVARPNGLLPGNGVLNRCKYPVLTSRHVPVFWRYDLDRKTNPRLLERIGCNAIASSGAIRYGKKYCLIVRVEGSDRRSFFAVADSPNGIDNFRFRDYPITMPETGEPDADVGDLRLTRHEDGWLYGIFRTDRRGLDAEAGDRAGVSAIGIARSKNLTDWERLPDLKAKSPRSNVVLHPELVGGKYAFYTCPQEGLAAGEGPGGGITWALVEDIKNAEISEETILDECAGRAIRGIQRGEGAAPIKTPQGWLHLVNGVQRSADGKCGMIGVYMTSLEDPAKKIAAPGGYLLTARRKERTGEAVNMLAANGWIADDDGHVLLYYSSGGSRVHVAVSTVKRLVDYCLNTPEDSGSSAASVAALNQLIERNLTLLRKF